MLLIINLYVSKKYDRYQSFSVVCHIFQSISLVGHFLHLGGVVGGGISRPLLHKIFKTNVYVP